MLNLKNILIIVSLFLAGCSSTGNNVNDDKTYTCNIKEEIKKENIDENLLKLFDNHLEKINHFLNKKKDLDKFKKVKPKIFISKIKDNQDKDIEIYFMRMIGNNSDYLIEFYCGNKNIQEHDYYISTDLIDNMTYYSLETNISFLEGSGYKIKTILDKNILEELF